MLIIDQDAPNFTLLDTNEKSISLSDFEGKKIILWFYPKASTPGWIVEGQGFRDEFNKFKEMNIQIVGVSADSTQKNKNFKTKQEFQYILLSDENHEMIENYGAWVKKNMYGREYMGIARISYLINEEGKIEYIFDKVKTKTHADDVLDILESRR